MWGEIPILVGERFVIRGKILWLRPSPDRLGRTRKFRPADDRARNNCGSVFHLRSSSITNLHVARHRPVDLRSLQQIRHRRYPNERAGRNRASLPDRNPAREFLRAARRKSCAGPKFCHLRSTWMDGSPSIVRFCCFISSLSFSSACAWAASSVTWKTSLSVAGKFPGGQSSPRSSPPKPPPPLSSDPPPKLFPSGITPTSTIP